MALCVLSGPASSLRGVCEFGGAAARRPIFEQWETDRQQARINTCLIGPAGWQGRPPTAEGGRQIREMEEGGCYSCPLCVYR